MPLKRRWNLAETDRGSYYKEEWIDKFLDSKGAFYNSNESQWCESYNEIMNSISYLKGLPIIASK